MARYIKIDGSETIVSPKNGPTFSGDELREYVDGWIEILALPSGDYMIIDEEGKLKNKPKNNRATLMAFTAGVAHDDYTVGNVLIVSKKEIDT